MKSKITWIAYVGGFFWAMTFFWYYFPRDYSQGIIFISIGLSAMAFGWCYDRISSLSNTLLAVEEYLVDKKWKKMK